MEERPRSEKEETRRRLRKLVLIGPLAMAGMALFAFLGGEVVKLLWNWLLPTLFGFQRIGFWQALGILALCRTLFGNWSGGSRSSSAMQRRMWERWDRMTPEERERIRQGFRRRWGAPEPPDAAPAS